MSLRTKESLEKFFEKSRERQAKKRAKEKELNKCGYFTDYYDSTHLINLISRLSNKSVLTESEEFMLHNAFDLLYPNGL